MAVDMFLELAGVKGESQDKAHKQKMDILAWQWGLANPGTLHQGSGGGAGKALFQDITISKYIDAASPTLMLFCANGKHFANGKLIVRKAGETPLEYLTIELEKVMIVSYSTGGSGGEDQLVESVGLHFAQIKFTYTEQAEGGGKGTSYLFGWNIPQNAKV